MRPTFTAALLALLAAPLTVAAQPQLTLPAPNTTSARLGQFETAVVTAYLSDIPTAATRAGLHVYDDRLPDLSAAAYAKRAQTARAQLAQLAAITAQEKLNAEDAADAHLLRAQFEETIYAAEQEQRWKHDPAIYASSAAGAIYALFSRDFAPLSDRTRSTIARERAIPAMLKAGEANVTTVDATTAELAKADIGGAITFFEKTVPAAYAGLQDAALKSQLEQSNAAAVTALRDYLAFMNAGPLAHPSGTFAIGAAAFAHRLELQEARAIPLDVYERVGERALEESKAQFIAVAKQIDPATTPGGAYAELGKHHPAGDQLIATAQSTIAKLRAFVTEKHLVTMPSEFDVTVAATPPFRAQTSFASMNTPGPFEHVATQGYYYVTVPEASWTPEQREQHLSFYNDAFLPIVTAHEVVPGHYLNFVLHKFQKLSLARALFSSPSYSEGWAHYDEQMVVDEGWGNGDPHVRLAQLQGALQREARYLVGLREHTQGMTVDAATKFFMDNAFMTQTAARREALRGTQDPLYGYYTLGKLEILKLREDYKKKLGSAYTLQKFHDAFLAHGDPPIAVLRPLLLGADDDGKLL